VPSRELQQTSPEGQHLPPQHTRPSGHSTPQPHSTQEAPKSGSSHTNVPGGHTQERSTQLAPTGQVLPQVPQLLSSVSKSTHLPLQSVSPNGHSQEPSTQLALSGHALPQVPQLLSSESKFTHAPLHSVSPDGHWQLSLTHWPPNGQQTGLRAVPQHGRPDGQQIWLLCTSPHTVPPRLRHLRRCLRVRATACVGNKGGTAAAKNAAPTHLRARPREMVPLASPLANSSKECPSIGSSLEGCLSPLGSLAIFGLPSSPQP
jgi:hypothetical protein